MSLLITYNVFIKKIRFIYDLSCQIFNVWYSQTYNKYKHSIWVLYLSYNQWLQLPTSKRYFTKKYRLAPGEKSIFLYRCVRRNWSLLVCKCILINNYRLFVTNYVKNMICNIANPIIHNYIAFYVVQSQNSMIAIFLINWIRSITISLLTPILLP